MADCGRSVVETGNEIVRCDVRRDIEGQADQCVMESENEIVRCGESHDSDDQVMQSSGDAHYYDDQMLSERVWKTYPGS